MSTFNYSRPIAPIIAIILSITSLQSYAQVEVLEDNPYQTSIILQLKLADFECGISDILRLGVGVRGDYFFPKILSVNAAWHQAVYSTMLASDAEIWENKNDNLSQFNMFEAGGRLHLLDRKRNIKAKGYLGSSGMYSYYAKLNGIPVRKIFALRGGMYSTVTPVTSRWSTLDNGIAGGIVTKDGSIIGRYTELFTNMRTSGLYGGFSWSEFANVKYKSHNKTWVSKYFKEVYFDLLYAPNVQFDPFITANPNTGILASHEIEPNMEGSLRTSNLGWRLGMYRVRSKRKVNVMFGLEAGARQGLFFKGGYFTSSVALSFSS
ncbi:MAG: hypothetical protein ACK417_04955 [Bacteroidia bacterium]